MTYKLNINTHFKRKKHKIFPELNFYMKKKNCKTAVFFFGGDKCFAIMGVKSI